MRSSTYLIRFTDEGFSRYRTVVLIESWDTSMGNTEKVNVATSVIKRGWQWLSGVGFTEPTLATNERLVAEVSFRAKWLTDQQLAQLMNTCEVEQVNRLAEAAGYYAMDDTMLLGPAVQENTNIKQSAPAAA